MSERGLCSRREADDYIVRGWVKVDGKVVNELGTRILPHQNISLSKQAKKSQQQRLTILLNKPLGFVSGQAEKNYPTAIELIKPENFFSPSVNSLKHKAFELSSLTGLAPAGRLDIDSTGLLVLTQDGRVAKRLVSADSDIEKEYLVKVQGEVTNSKIEKLKHGFSLDGQKLKRAGIEQLHPGELRFLLKQGRKRQIRRMCELVDLKVTRLKRVRIGEVKLGKLPLGKWRLLRPGEHF